MSAPDRRLTLDRDHPTLSLRRQCALLGVARSGVYRQRRAANDDDLALMRRIDALFLRWPFLGSRRMVAMLAAEGIRVNRKRVRRLMGIVPLGPKPRTSKPGAGHKIYPYLLRGLVIDRPNQVWCADITYLPIGRGFLYLVAIMDWRTRLALAHKGLPVETVAWRFTEKDAIAKSRQGKVPVLVAGDRWIYESWNIAEYLEDTYPDRPSLFGCPQGRAVARFVNQWASEVLHPAVARVVVPEIPAALHELDKEYFRTTREAAFGRTFEAIAAERDEAVAALNRTLAPLRSTLANQPFAPRYLQATWRR